MRRALFGREFRAALVPNLVTVGAILGTLAAVEKLYGLRLGKAEDISIVIDFVLLIGLVASGFIAGERCFPAELKEQRMLFLSSLPMSRGWTWLAIVSARLAAAVLSMALAIVLRRPLLTLGRTEQISQLEIAQAAGLLLLSYCLLFAAGTLFALLFRRTLFVYAVGYPLLGLLLVEAFLADSYSTYQPWLESLQRAPFEARPGTLLLLAAFLSLLLLPWLLLSRWCFVRGEIGNPTRRIKNQFLFGFVTAMYLGLVFGAAGSASLAEIHDTWEEIDSSWAWAEPLNKSEPYGVSADGRYLFVLETLKDRHFFVRVTVVDTRSGQIQGRSIYGGLGWAFWSETGDVLNLLVLNNTPFGRWGYLRSGAVEWIRLTPEAREISQARFRGVDAVKILPGGYAVVADRDDDQSRVLLLDGASGRFSARIRAAADGDIVIQADGPVALVYFDNILLRKRAWVLDPSVHEVHAPGARSILVSRYSLFGDIFSSRAEVQSVLRRKLGQPSTTKGEPITGSFVLPDHDRPWILSPGVPPRGLYFLEETALPARILWARSTTGGRWEKLPELAPEPFYENHNAYIEMEYRPPVSIDFDSGCGAFLTKDGATRRLLVYDPQVGVIKGPVVCRAGEKMSLGTYRVGGLKGVLIQLLCLGKPFRGTLLQHLPGSPEIREIGKAPHLSLPLYFDEAGGIWRSGEGRIWRSSPEGKESPLWSPGATP